MSFQTNPLAARPSPLIWSRYGESLGELRRKSSGLVVVLRRQTDLNCGIECFATGAAELVPSGESRKKATDHPKRKACCCMIRNTETARRNTSFKGQLPLERCIGKPTAPRKGTINL